MKPLVNVTTFGAIDADNDEILFDAFEEHEAIDSLLNFQRFLIVGRKGSGKTAIFKKLLDTRNFDFFSFGHTFSDYPWHHHDKQARTGIPSRDKYTHSWKYLILLTLSKIVLNHDSSIPFDEESMSRTITVERFVIDSYGTRDPDVTQVFNPARSLRLKPHFEIDWKVLKAGISPESVPIAELPTIVQEVNQNLTAAILTCLNPDHKYHICFDQLDLGFDPNDDEYASRLIGLLIACRDINQQAKQYGKRLMVSVFLRDDIYDMLHFEDKNKITENHLSRIEWDTARTQKTLKGLMEKRFTKLLGDSNNTRVTWEDIFDETKEMRGHQSKYQHILDHTYLRPRDIIKFCNEVLKEFKRRAVKDIEAKAFDNMDINSAKTEYSHYFSSELDDELHKHIPEYRDYFEVFKSIGVVQFDRDEYLRGFDAKRASLPQGAEPMKVLRSLFEFSVVGFLRSGGRGYGGSEYVFNYEDPRAQFDDTAQRFRLHYGLIDVLGLKLYSRT